MLDKANAPSNGSPEHRTRRNRKANVNRQKAGSSTSVKRPVERTGKSSNVARRIAERPHPRESSSPHEQNEVPLTAERGNQTPEPIHEQTEPAVINENANTERLEPSQSRSEAKPRVAEMSEFIHKPQPFIQQDPERSERITKQQALFKLQTTVRELRKCDLSYAAIERITTVPRATAHLWASDVEPIRPNPNTSDSTHSDQSTSYDGGDRDSYTPQIPRVSSEVVAPRPIVVEENHPYESHSSISTNDGQSLSSQPLDVDILRLLFSRQPEWIDVFLSIKAASVAAGEKDAIRFFYDQVMTDSEDADFFRAVVPHEAGDQEGLRENFMMIVRQANAYAEAAKRSGLDMRKSVELS